jgi:hypothetical protein
MELGIAALVLGFEAMQEIRAVLAFPPREVGAAEPFRKEPPKNDEKTIIFAEQRGPDEKGPGPAP